MQVHQHVLLKLGLSVRRFRVDGDRIVVSIETVDEGLNGRLVNVSYIGRSLTSFAARNHGLGLDESESVDYNLALDRLNGVNHDGYGAWVERLKGLREVPDVRTVLAVELNSSYLLCIDINAR